MKSQSMAFLLAIFCSCCFVVGFCDQQGRPVTYRVTYNTETGEEVARAEEPIKCYRFIWAGPLDEDNVNTTTSCDFFLSEGIPCYEPIVWTNGTNSLNGPNLTQIEEKCAAGETVSGEVCDPFCTKGSHSCVLMTGTLRDKGHSIVYQSHFCGDGIDVANGNQIMTKGCHQMKGVGDMDVEACFCQGDKCNKAGTAIQDLLAMLVAALVLLLNGSST